MNERIKELMQQADRKCSETRGVYDEILAMLIIQECVRIDIENPDAAPGAEIAKHFGVEE